jgi:hypothetical protein
MATPSVRATATPDPRIAVVEAAVRRYVEAVEASARTGDPTAVNALVVPGSQAAGNAAITADFSRENYYNFIASRIDYNAKSWNIVVANSTATASVRYMLYGHAADWPSLHSREPDHETPEVELKLQFDLRDGNWLVSQSS